MNAEPKLLRQAIYGPEYGFRPNTRLSRWVINFTMNEGGMGDLVNYTAALKWLSENCPWIEGRVFVSEFLTPLVRDIVKGWKVFPSEKFSRYYELNTAMVGPTIVVNGINTTKQLITSLRNHPLDIGFAYYAGICPAPAGAMLPILDYPKSQLPKSIKKTVGPYAVVPTGNTADGYTRTVLGRHINPILEYLLSLKITPVFLGKKDLLGNGKATTTFAEDIRYDLGLDLRGQTSVKEAASILQYAALTVGLDCGLLHLAALMKDSRIVFGYNIAAVEHRAPRRTWGKTVNVALTEKELACIACQSRYTNLGGHHFGDCIHEAEDTLELAKLGKPYETPKCVDMLFENDVARWKSAIEEVLK